MNHPHALQVSKATSIKITTATTATVALPAPANGEGRYYLVVADLPCYVNFGDSTVTAVLTSAILIPGNYPMLFMLAGDTHVASLIFKAVAAELTITPLENG